MSFFNSTIVKVCKLIVFDENSRKRVKNKKRHNDIEKNLDRIISYIALSGHIDSSIQEHTTKIIETCLKGFSDVEHGISQLFRNKLKQFIKKIVHHDSDNTLFSIVKMLDIYEENESVVLFLLEELSTNCHFINPVQTGRFAVLVQPCMNNLIKSGSQQTMKVLSNCYGEILKYFAQHVNDYEFRRLIESALIHLGNKSRENRRYSIEIIVYTCEHVPECPIEKAFEMIHHKFIENFETNSYFLQGAITLLHRLLLLIKDLERKTTSYLEHYPQLCKSVIVVLEKALTLTDRNLLSPSFIVLAQLVKEYQPVCIQWKQDIIEKIFSRLIELLRIMKVKSIQCTILSTFFEMLDVKPFRSCFAQAILRQNLSIQDFLDFLEEEDYDMRGKSYLLLSRILHCRLPPKFMNSYRRIGVNLNLLGEDNDDDEEEEEEGEGNEQPGKKVVSVNFEERNVKDILLSKIRNELDPMALKMVVYALHELEPYGNHLFEIDDTFWGVKVEIMNLVSQVDILKYEWYQNQRSCTETISRIRFSQKLLALFWRYICDNDPRTRSKAVDVFLQSLPFLTLSPALRLNDQLLNEIVYDNRVLRHHYRLSEIQNVCAVVKKCVVMLTIPDKNVIQGTIELLGKIGRKYSCFSEKSLFVYTSSKGIKVLSHFCYEIIEKCLCLLRTEAEISSDLVLHGQVISAIGLFTLFLRFEEGEHKKPKLKKITLELMKFYKILLLLILGGTSGGGLTLGNVQGGARKSTKGGGGSRSSSRKSTSSARRSTKGSVAGKGEEGTPNPDIFEHPDVKKEFYNTSLVFEQLKSNLLKTSQLRSKGGHAQNLIIVSLKTELLQALYFLILFGDQETIVNDVVFLVRLVDRVRAHMDVGLMRCKILIIQELFAAVFQRKENYLEMLLPIERRRKRRIQVPTLNEILFSSTLSLEKEPFHRKQKKRYSRKILGGLSQSELLGLFQIVVLKIKNSFFDMNSDQLRSTVLLMVSRMCFVGVKFAKLDKDRLFLKYILKNLHDQVHIFKSTYYIVDLISILIFSKTQRISIDQQNREHMRQNRGENGEAVEPRNVFLNMDDVANILKTKMVNTKNEYSKRIIIDSLIPLILRSINSKEFDYGKKMIALFLENMNFFNSLKSLTTLLYNFSRVETLWNYLSISVLEHLVKKEQVNRMNVLKFWDIEKEVLIIFEFADSLFLKDEQKGKYKVKIVSMMKRLIGGGSFESQEKLINRNLMKFLFLILVFLKDIEKEISEKSAKVDSTKGREEKKLLTSPLLQIGNEDEDVMTLMVRISLYYLNVVKRSRSYSNQNKTSFLLAKIVDQITNYVVYVTPSTNFANNDLNDHLNELLNTMKFDIRLLQYHSPPLFLSVFRMTVKLIEKYRYSDFVQNFYMNEFVEFLFNFYHKLERELRQKPVLHIERKEYDHNYFCFEKLRTLSLTLMRFFEIFGPPIMKKFEKFIDDSLLNTIFLNCYRLKSFPEIANMIAQNYPKKLRSYLRGCLNRSPSSTLSSNNNRVQQPLTKIERRRLKQYESLFLPRVIEEEESKVKKKKRKKKKKKPKSESPMSLGGENTEDKEIVQNALNSLLNDDDEEDEGEEEEEEGELDDVELFFKKKRVISFENFKDTLLFFEQLQSCTYQSLSADDLFYEITPDMILSFVDSISTTHFDNLKSFHEQISKLLLILLSFSSGQHQMRKKNENHLFLHLQEIILNRVEITSKILYYLDSLKLDYETKIQPMVPSFTFLIDHFFVNRAVIPKFNNFERTIDELIRVFFIRSESKTARNEEICVPIPPSSPHVNPEITLLSKIAIPLCRMFEPIAYRRVVQLRGVRNMEVFEIIRFSRMFLSLGLRHVPTFRKVWGVFWDLIKSVTCLEQHTSTSGNRYLHRLQILSLRSVTILLKSITVVSNTKRSKIGSGVVVMEHVYARTIVVDCYLSYLWQIVIPGFFKHSEYELFLEAISSTSELLSSHEEFADPTSSSILQQESQPLSFMNIYKNYYLKMRKMEVVSSWCVRRALIFLLSRLYALEEQRAMLRKKMENASSKKKIDRVVDGMIISPEEKRYEEIHEKMKSIISEEIIKRKKYVEMLFCCMIFVEGGADRMGKGMLGFITSLGKRLASKMNEIKEIPSSRNNATAAGNSNQSGDARASWRAFSKTLNQTISPLRNRFTSSSSSTTPKGKKGSSPQNNKKKKKKKKKKGEIFDFTYSVSPELFHQEWFFIKFYNFAKVLVGRYTEASKKSGLYSLMNKFEDLVIYS